MNQQTSYTNDGVDEFMLEPTPILPSSHGGKIEVLPTVTSLPLDLQTFSLDYIKLLKGVAAEVSSVLQTGNGNNNQGRFFLSSSQTSVPALDNFSSSSPNTRSIYSAIPSAPEVASTFNSDDLLRSNSFLSGTGDEEMFDDTSHETPTTGDTSHERVIEGSPTATNSSTAQELALHSYQVQQWLERYQDLSAFFQKHGHSNVPYDYEEDPGLVLWVKRQRNNYKEWMQGRRSHLTEERFQLLSKLNFEWDFREKRWNKSYQKLVAYYAKYGTPNVPLEYDRSLSNWIKRQKRLYRLFFTEGQKFRALPCMTDERADLLSRAGLKKPVTR